jgi:hypothetical protein
MRSKFLFFMLLVLFRFRSEKGDAKCNDHHGHKHQRHEKFHSHDVFLLLSCLPPHCTKNFLPANHFPTISLHVLRCKVGQLPENRSQTFSVCEYR